MSMYYLVEKIGKPNHAYIALRNMKHYLDVSANLWFGFKKIGTNHPPQTSKFADVESARKALNKKLITEMTLWGHEYISQWIYKVEQFSE